MPHFIGIDLSGKSTRPTGIACINEGLEVVSVKHLKLDVEILSYINLYRPKCVAIDAPLTLPLEGRGYRLVERKMLKEGFRLYPPLTAWMKHLSLRAIKLKETIESMNIKVIETHPTSVLRQLGYTGERKADKILKFVKEALELHVNLERLSIHMVDAIICALVALRVCKGEGLVYRDVDGEIYLL